MITDTDTPPPYTPESSAGPLIDKKQNFENEKLKRAPTVLQPPEIPVDSAPQEQEQEQYFRELLEQLRSAIASYKAARSENRDEVTMKRHQSEVLALMNNVANAAPDPQIRGYYLEKAANFSKANTAKEKDGILQDAGKTVLVILSAPLAVAAAGLHVAGGILHAAGSVLKGTGEVFHHKKVTEWVKEKGKGKGKGSKDASWDIE